MGALRFLYKKTLRRRDIDFDDLPLVRAPKKLPGVLSQEESRTADRSCSEPVTPHFAPVALRNGTAESRSCPPEDRRYRYRLMLIHVHQGKGSRDRDLPLTTEAARGFARVLAMVQESSLVRISFQATVEPVSPSVPSPIRSCGMPATKQRFAQGSRNGSARTLCDTVLRRICSKPARTCARSSSCWASASQRYRDLFACIPQTSAGGHQSTGSDLDPGLSRKMTGFLTTSNDTPTLGGGRCHSAGRQSISRSLSKVFDLAAGQGLQRHHALPYGRARRPSRSVRSLPASDRLL